MFWGYARGQDSRDSPFSWIQTPSISLAYVTVSEEYQYLDIEYPKTATGIPDIMLSSNIPEQVITIMS